MTKTRMFALLIGFAALFASFAAPAQAQDCSTMSTTTTLVAGQNYDAGTVTVSNDASNLFVRYTTSSPWVLSEVHLDVAGSLADIPQTHSGNPKPGHFAYSTIFDPEATDFTFTIPLTGFVPGQPIYIAAHAIVQAPASSGGTQTAWGFGPGFEGANWATYIQYTVCGHKNE
jgi:hypothetical protein